MLPRTPCPRSPTLEPDSDKGSLALASPELLVQLKMQYCGDAQKPQELRRNWGFQKCLGKPRWKTGYAGVRSSLRTGTTGNSVWNRTVQSGVPAFS